MIVNISFLIAAVAMVVAVVAAAITYEMHEKVNSSKISFKEALDLVDLPVITFINNGKKLNFLLDTGSSSSHINKELVDNDIIKYVDANYSTLVSGMEGTERKNKVIYMDITLNNNKFTDKFIVNDLSSVFSIIKQEKGVTLHGIIGTPFFDRYNYIIDFNRYIAYSKN